jgi:hypothetical protein
MKFISELIKPFFIFLLIFLAIFIVSSKIVQNRESQCAKKCSQAGAKNYSYHGFTGGLHIDADTCSCIH